MFNFSILSVALWHLPDIVIFITTIVAYVIIKKLTVPSEDIEENASPSTSAAADTEEDDGPSYTFENYILLKRTGKCEFSPSFSLSIFSIFHSFRFSCGSSNFLCTVNTFDCCNTAAIRSKCRLFSHFLINRNRLGPIQRYRSWFCNHLSNSCRSIDRTYQCTVDISNTMATTISRCK